MKQNLLYFGLVALAIATIATIYYYTRTDKHALRVLPFIEPIEEGLKKNIPAGGHHTVRDFQLTDQSGKVVTRKDFSKSITVVDFFFSTCTGICPKMNSQLDRVYAKYKGNPQVRLLSHTVDPETDSVSTLAAYAKTHKADATQWHFVTGDKVQLYALARQSYLIDDTQGDGGKEDFVHSQNFALVDPNGNIRGIYDGINPNSVDQLMADMDVLLAEFSAK